MPPVALGSATPTGAGKDEPRAAKLYEKGCEGGDASGCRYFGHVLLKGIGVRKDPALATRYHRRACDGGEAKACEALHER